MKSYSFLKYFFISIFSLILQTGQNCFAMTNTILKENVFYIENFQDLSRWTNIKVRGTEKLTVYTIEKKESESFLKTESDASASLLLLKTNYSIYEFPKLKWRWKVMNVYSNGNGLYKNTDDFPIRIFIMFKFDPVKSPFGQKFVYDIAKLFYGQYPPDSALIYAWDSVRQETNIINNANREQGKQVILEYGCKNCGVWQSEEVNVLEDYEKAFGRKPPELVTLSIMNDSDNTGEKSVSYLDNLVIFNNTP
jgi:hypothetical protein